MQTRSAPKLHGIRTLSLNDPDWPQEFDKVKPPIEAIELVGSLPDFATSVAIVGTRFCDPWASEFARVLARDLANAGRTIVSGGAMGIDAAAHEGALEAGGGTVVVLPSGLAEPYPKANRALFHRAAEHGCVLSEVQRRGAIQRRSFLERNRLVAALAPVLIVVQAPIQSGSLSTAAHAKRLGRQVFAVPAAPWDTRGTGCLLLLSGGAGICRSAADVLSIKAVGATNALPRVPITPRKVKEYQGVDEDQRAVVEALSGGPMGADDLCGRANLEPSRVQRAILMLLLSKVIQEDGGGRYRRAETS